jgi:hypothetical protein
VILFHAALSEAPPPQSSGATAPLQERTASAVLAVTRGQSKKKTVEAV